MGNIRQISDLRKAFHLMVGAHDGVYRKFEGTEYAYHPVAVAQIVKKNKVSKNKMKLIIAALLHDTVEDAPELVNIELIKKMFGEVVASLVNELTSDSYELEKLGKQEYLLQKMLKMTSYALVIKLADRLHNCTSLVKATKKFRDNYVRQTRYIIDGLKKRYLSDTHKNLISQIDTFISVYE